MDFQELFKQLQSEEAVNNVGKGSKGPVGKFGVNQDTKLKIFYGNNKEGDTPQITIHVTTKEGGSFMGWIQEPLALTRKGVKNDALKKFTKEQLLELFKKGKAGKASSDEMLYLQDYVEKFNQQKAYLKNIFEVYFSNLEGEELEKRTVLWKNIVRMTDFPKMLMAFMKMFPLAKNDFQHKDTDHYIKSHKMSKAIEVDTFLQYQWSLKKGNKKTYLELPKNIKQGRVFSPPQKGEFTAIKGDTYLAINEDGVEHPLTRNEWFMSSKFGTQQTTGEETSVDMSTDAEETTWGDFVSDNSDTDTDSWS